MTSPRLSRSSQTESRRVHRVNVNFSEGAYAELQRLAAIKGKSISDVLRDAISLEMWFQDTIASGARVLVERNGTAREVISR